LRKSRLHDEKGNFASWKNVILHGGPALASALLRVTTGYRPALPWIAYTTIRVLGDFLNRDSRVLEFGSGMSTLWYAQRARDVFSTEDNPSWYDRVGRMVKVKGLDNVTHVLAASEEDYFTFMSEDTEGFDLVMVDGSHRSQCVAHAAERVKPGGILYLDNSDKDSAAAGGDMRTAERLAREFAKKSGAQVSEITDFAPAQFFAQQGLCIKLPD